MRWEVNIPISLMAEEVIIPIALMRLELTLPLPLRWVVVIHLPFDEMGSDYPNCFDEIGVGHREVAITLPFNEMRGVHSPTLQ